MTEDQELFNVVIFFPDGTYNYENNRKPLPIEDALKLTKSFITRPAARLGMIKEVMITDLGDNCCFHWTKEKGVIFPSQQEETK